MSPDPNAGQRPFGLSAELSEFEKKRKLETRFARQLGSADQYFLEIRDKRTGAPYGFVRFPFEHFKDYMVVPNDIEFKVHEPDHTQRNRAVVESSDLNFEGLALTAQAKRFEVKFVERDGGRLSLVAEVGRNDLWTILRDPRFCRSREFAPVRADDLSWCDIDLLSNISSHGKAHPNRNYEEELAGLKSAGLVEQTDHAKRPLALTSKGTELLKSASKLRD